MHLKIKFKAKEKERKKKSNILPIQIFGNTANTQLL